MCCSTAALQLGSGSESPYLTVQLQQRAGAAGRFGGGLSRRNSSAAGCLEGLPHSGSARPPTRPPPCAGRPVSPCAGRPVHGPLAPGGFDLPARRHDQVIR